MRSRNPSNLTALAGLWCASSAGRLRWGVQIPVLSSPPEGSKIDARSVEPFVGSSRGRLDVGGYDLHSDADERAGERKADFVRNARTDGNEAFGRFRRISFRFSRGARAGRSRRCTRRGRRWRRSSLGSCRAFRARARLRHRIPRLADTFLRRSRWRGTGSSTRCRDQGGRSGPGGARWRCAPSSRSPRVA